MKLLEPWPRCGEQLRRTDLIRPVGRVTRLSGMVVEVTGITGPLGAVCRIETGRHTPPAACEVVGFRRGSLLLMPYGDTAGIAPGQLATIVARRLTVPVGPELLGRVVDGLGRPLDGGPPLHHLPQAGLGASPPPPLSRLRRPEILPTGIRAIDGLTTVARGQRLGIFAGSGVGKSVLLGMLARHALVDVGVVALVGERGREVREFLERDLGPKGRERCVVVVVTSDQSAVMRSKGAETAMTIAESFRAADRNVLFLMDSATRYAMALREIGLAAGEPPTTKGYPPSVFAMLPRLCERAGWSDTNAITAFFSVLIEGDDIHDPVGDALRSFLDGHLVLSRDLAREGHYPAIDVLSSISRMRDDVTPPPVQAASTRVLRWLKALHENRDLINIGAYARGSDPLVDEALAHRQEMAAFLQQEIDAPVQLAETFAALQSLAGGS
jgi:flagellum-specific ATP synthase